MTTATTTKPETSFSLSADAALAMLEVAYDVASTDTHRSGINAVKIDLMNNLLTVWATDGMQMVKISVDVPLAEMTDVYSGLVSRDSLAPVIRAIKSIPKRDRYSQVRFTLENITVSGITFPISLVDANYPAVEKLLAGVEVGDSKWACDPKFLQRLGSLAVKHSNGVVRILPPKTGSSPFQITFLQDRIEFHYVIMPIYAQW